MECLLPLIDECDGESSYIYLPTNLRIDGLAE